MTGAHTEGYRMNVSNRSMVAGLMLACLTSTASGGKVEVPKVPTNCKMKNKELDLGPKLTQALTNTKLTASLVKQLKKEQSYGELSFLLDARAFLKEPSLKLFDALAKPIVDKDLNPGGSTGGNDGLCLIAYFQNFSARIRNGELATKTVLVKALVSWAATDINASFAEPLGRWLRSEDAKDFFRPGWRKTDKVFQEQQAKERKYKEEREVEKKVLKGDGLVGGNFEIGQTLQTRSKETRKKVTTKKKTKEETE